MENDSYDPKRSKSFEYNNFYLQLKALPYAEVHYLPFDRIRQVGRRQFNQELLETVKKIRPDLFFAFMYTDEFDRHVLGEIKNITTSIAWFADDIWRFGIYSRFWAPHFSWVVSTWSGAPAAYARYGIKNVIRSQWACNTSTYKPVPTEKDIDVSMVGMRTKPRAKIIADLRKAGIKVFAAGAGWPEGRISLNDYLNLVSRSRINLNLNSPTSAIALKPIGHLFFRRSCHRIVPDFWHFPRNLRSYFYKKNPQIKARPFEIAGCAGFCISGRAEDMENYYTPGKEMVFYEDTPDLIEKIKYYLKHSGEREAIAAAGYERTLKDHTYARRFEEIFQRIGLH